MLSSACNKLKGERARDKLSALRERPGVVRVAGGSVCLSPLRLAKREIKRTVDRGEEDEDCEQVEPK